MCFKFMKYIDIFIYKSCYTAKFEHCSWMRFYKELVSFIKSVNFSRYANFSV